MTKEQLDLPIYKSKSIKTKQYVEGYLKTCTDTGANVYWIHTKDWVDYQIEPETLSISFPNMMDSENTRIFASLSYSGKGGDITKTKDGWKVYKRVHLFSPDGTRAGRDVDVMKILSKKYNSVLDIKVIGIQE